MPEFRSGHSVSASRHRKQLRFREMLSPFRRHSGFSSNTSKTPTNPFESPTSPLPTTTNSLWPTGGTLTSITPPRLRPSLQAAGSSPEGRTLAAAKGRASPMHPHTTAALPAPAFPPSFSHPLRIPSITQCRLDKTSAATPWEPLADLASLAPPRPRATQAQLVLGE